MKHSFKGTSLAHLCSWFGVTRQAYYQGKQRLYQNLLEEETLITEIKNIRKLHKRLGGRKLFYKLEPFMKTHKIHMGRDAFFDVLRTNGLLIKPRKSYHKTTQSKHWMRKYPNLIRDVEPMGPNHIWVSDLTYWKTRNGHCYISFITDAYSRKIVGYQVADNMEAVETLEALKMAMKTLKPGHSGLIHHSDRGTQYCSSKYVSALKKKQIQISMTENGDPLENAIAERLNGIIKGEYLFDYNIENLNHARTVLKAVVNLYNNDRPHASLNHALPTEIHENQIAFEVKRLWKNYYNKDAKPSLENESCKPTLG